MSANPRVRRHAHHYQTRSNKRMATEDLRTSIDVTKSDKVPAGFGELPADALIAIAEQCGHSDLARLCSVAKGIHKCLVHVLYRTVALSYHNQGIVSVNHDGEMKQIWSDNSACTIHIEGLKRKQIALLKTMIAHPEYGVHIQNLSYSIQIFRTEDPAETLRTIWTVFSMLTNVRQIDIAWLSEPHQLHDPDNNKLLPPTLFSSASSVYFVGPMGLALPHLILHSISLANLQHLTLSNLQECGEPYRSFDPNFPVLIAGPRHKDHGTMRPLLPCLTGKCSNLHSLTIRKVAKVAPNSFDTKYFQEEDALYMDIAAFIKSVAPTLGKLTFEQGPLAWLHNPADPDVERHHAAMWEGVPRALAQQIQAEQDAAKAGGYWPLRSGGTYRACDLAFSQTILSAILGEQWPRLKELKINGVGSWDEAWTNLAADNLSGLGPRVDVKVEQESRTFELAGLNEAMQPAAVSTVTASGN